MAGTAIVIGAGVGGLTAAVALRRRDWDVTVYERAAAVEEVGAGIALAPNALSALEAIGVGDRVRELSALQGEAGIRRADGRWLSRTSAEAAEARFGRPTVVLHRAALVALLAGALPEDVIRLGTEATVVDAAEGRVRIGGREVTADLVVAADGINSPTRALLFPEHPGRVYSGVTSWRLVVPPDGLPVLAGESWGRGTVFGTALLADGRIYCYATAPAPPGASAPSAPGGAPDEKAELARIFRDFHAPIPALIDAADTVLRTDIYCLDTPPERFHEGRVALLGDAAHAMTPNLGQGGCQAIEDAVVLAALADQVGGLALYTEQRRPRTAMIAERSRRICGMTKVRSPLGVAARDAGMALAGKLGPNIVLRQMDPILGWHPPA